jgi:Tfp pilus assembly protein PilZ
VDGPGVVCNLSVKGTYVAIKPVPKVGEQVVVALELPWLAEPMTMDAVVCWDNSDSKVHGLPPGCGLEFLATTREDQERIEAVVRAFAPHG